MVYFDLVFDLISHIFDLKMTVSQKPFILPITEIRPLSIDVCYDQRHLMAIFDKTCICVLAAKCEND